VVSVGSREVVVAWGARIASVRMESSVSTWHRRAQAGWQSPSESLKRSWCGVLRSLDQHCCSTIIVGRIPCSLLLHFATLPRSVMRPSMLRTDADDISLPIPSNLYNLHLHSLPSAHRLIGPTSALCLDLAAASQRFPRTASPTHNNATASDTPRHVLCRNALLW
jgi:hypothetical protein